MTGQKPFQASCSRWAVVLLLQLMLWSSEPALAVDAVTAAKTNDLRLQDEGVVADWMVVVKRGDIVAVKKYYWSRVNVNVCGKDGWSALMWSSMLGHTEVARFLLSKGADARATNNEGSNAMMLAAMNGRVDAVRVLLKAGCPPDKANEYGATALMLAAMGGHEETTRVLLAAKANPNLRDKYNNTALILAAQQAHEKVVQLLLVSGAEVGAENQDGWTALGWATARKHLAIAEMLKNAGARRGLSDALVGFVGDGDAAPPTSLR